MRNIEEYKTIVFDCDGVILNSNRIKTEGFEYSVKNFGDEAVKEIKNYHLKNGGVSRIEKFKYFISNIYPKLDLRYKKISPDINQLLNLYSKYVYDKLLKCEINFNLKNFKIKTLYSQWMVVSGGSEIEISKIFLKRKIDKLFELGIFGNPDDKITILKRELSKSSVKKPIVYIGDSKYDYESAKSQNIDFIFLSKWTEVNEWKIWCDKNKIENYPDFNLI
tara:strand:- start:155 stop:817 length:663 start_codon:yes stop_codon:yes gene_type:complete